jgi:hypothetical protein
VRRAGLHEGVRASHLTHASDRRPALTLFLAASSLVVALWAYMDVYVGWIQKQPVVYEEMRQLTHVILISVAIAGFR